MKPANPNTQSGGSGNWVPVAKAGKPDVLMQWQLGAMERGPAKNAELSLRTAYRLIRGEAGTEIPYGWTGRSTAFEDRRSALAAAEVRARTAREELDAGEGTIEYHEANIATVEKGGTLRTAYEDTKKRLPALIVGARCKEGERKTLSGSTGYVVVDFDHTSDATAQLRLALMETGRVATAFISPSGEGVKAIVPVDPIPDSRVAHEAAIKAAWADLRSARPVIGVLGEPGPDDALDTSGKDPARLCFLYRDLDPKALWKESPEPVPWSLPATLTEAAPSKPRIEASPPATYSPEAYPEIDRAEFMHWLRTRDMTKYEHYRDAMGAARCYGVPAGTFAKIAEHGGGEYKGEADVLEHWAKDVKRDRFVHPKTVFTLPSKPGGPTNSRTGAPRDITTAASVPSDPSAATAESVETPKDLYDHGNEWPKYEGCEPRQWLIHGWLPFRMGMLNGRGGSGKSWLALQLACAVAAGSKAVPHGRFIPVTPDGRGNERREAERNRIGKLEIEPSTAVIFSAEDEAEELQRRRADLARSLPWAKTESIDDRLHWFIPGGKHASTLWGPDPDKGSGHISTTGVELMMGAELQKYCEGEGAKLLVIDNAAAAFGGDENQRALVRQFLNHWDRWAIKTKTAVVLIGHPPKNTKDSGATYSGSTDWEAGSRFLWTLGKQPIGGPTAKRKDEAGKEIKGCSDREGYRFELVKCNYSRAGFPKTWLDRLPGGAWQQCSMKASADQVDSRSLGQNDPDHDPGYEPDPMPGSIEMCVAEGGKLVEKKSAAAKKREQAKRDQIEADKQGRLNVNHDGQEPAIKTQGSFV